MLLNLFSLLLLILSSFSAFFFVLIIMCREEFLFLSYLFGILYDSCMFMAISFFRCGKFSSIILLKIFAGPLCWKSSFSPSPIIHRFGLLIVSWNSWMFCVRIFLHFTFSLLCHCFLWYLLHWDYLFYLLYSVCYACPLINIYIKYWGLKLTCLHKNISNTKLIFPPFIILYDP